METDKITFTVGESEQQNVTFEVGNTNYIVDQNYNILKNKPKINGVELVGNKTLEELGINLSQFEKVEELPTTGQSNTIYLVPRTTEEEKNIYDEYIFINEKWEKIGSTDIDLTGYINSEQLEEAIANSKEITVWTPENGQLKIWQQGSGLYHLLGQPVSVAINQNISVGINGHGLLLINSFYSTQKQYFLIDTYSGMIWVGQVGSNGYNYYSKSLTIKNALTTDNTTSYDITSDYNPAHKKYVDEVVATKQNTLTAGDNITIDENNVISASGGVTEEYVNEVIANANGIKKLSGTVYIQQLEDGIYQTEPETYIYLTNSSGQRYAYPCYIFLATGMSRKNVLMLVGTTVNSFDIKGGAYGSSLSTNTFSLSTRYLLTSDNTSSYNVTSNYQPAHKLYVDTAISTAVGDINTILATLTTVEEVAE